MIDVKDLTHTWFQHHGATGTGNRIILSVDLMNLVYFLQTTDLRKIFTEVREVTRSSLKTGQLKYATCSGAAMLFHVCFLYIRIKITGKMVLKNRTNILFKLSVCISLNAVYANLLEEICLALN